MRLKRITLKNFGCHKELVLDLAAVTKVLGPGGSGKSTILAAAEIATIGITDRITDMKGAAFRPIATYGQTDCSVVTEWDDPVHGDVVWSRGFSGPLHKDQTVMLTVGGIAQGEKASREALEKMFYSMTCRPVVWRLLFDSDKFSTLSGDDCQRFLFALTSGGVTTEDVQARLQKVIDERLWPAALRIWKAESNPLDFDRTLGRLQRIRPDKRRVVDGYKAALAAQPEPVDKSRLAELKLKKSGIEQQQKVIDSIPDPTQEIDDLEGRIERYEAGPHDLAMLERLVAERKQAVTEAHQLQFADVGLMAEVKQLEAAFFDAKTYFGADTKKSDVKPPKCPVCTTPITKAKLQAIQKKLEAVKKQVADAEKNRKNHAAAEELLQVAERAVQDHATQERTYRSWQDVVAKLRKEDLPKWQNRPDRTKLNTDLVDVLKELDGLEAADKQAAERVEAGKKLDGAKVEFEAVQALITAYEPDGIRKEIAAGATEFTKNVTKGIKGFFGGEADISFTDGTVTRDGKIWEPLSGLSDSEAARVGIAVQLGLGMATGVWLVMTDHLAEMSPEDQRLVLRYLSKFLEGDGSSLLLQQIPDVPTEDGKAITADEYIALERKRLATKLFTEYNLSVYALDVAHKLTRLK